MYLIADRVYANFFQLYNDLSNFRSHAKKAARVALTQVYNLDPHDMNAAEASTYVKEIYNQLVEDSVFLHYETKEVCVLTGYNTD
jgi:Domain of unknown function (DUF6532)